MSHERKFTAERMQYFSRIEVIDIDYVTFSLEQKCESENFLYVRIVHIHTSYKKFSHFRFREKDTSAMFQNLLSVLKMYNIHKL